MQGLKSSGKDSGEEAIIATCDARQHREEGAKDSHSGDTKPACLEASLGKRNNTAA